MRVWVDVFDASGNRLGDGPVVAVTQATVSRALDGAGSFNLRCIGTDERAFTLLTNERRVKIYHRDISGSARLMGDGIIRKRRLTDNPGGVTLVVSGPDLLDELKRRTVLLGRIYNQQTVSAVASALIALVPGWTVSVDSSIASNVVDMRLDGVSVLKAFQVMAERYGYHLRSSATASKQLEIGPFGDDNGLRVHKIEVVTSEVITNPDILLVRDLSPEDDTEDVCNWLLPIGAGEGSAAVTLEKSTRTSPYTIQSLTGPDGATLYYLSDAGSISTYGEIRKVGQFKDIAPLENTDADIVNAANALYDAAARYLDEHKNVQKAYSLTVNKVQDTILPGDKIRIDYLAQIDTPDGTLDYIDIRDDFWILKASERVTLDGVSTDLEISNFDRMQKGEAEAVVQAMESIEMRGYNPGQNISTRTFQWYYLIDTPHVSPNLEFWITEATREVLRVTMWIKFYKDTDTISGVVVYVNGNDETLALFGTSTIGGGATPLPIQADSDAMTTAVVNNSSGLRSKHTIEVNFPLAIDNGAFEVQMEITEVLQAIRL